MLNANISEGNENHHNLLTNTKEKSECIWQENLNKRRTYKIRNTKKENELFKVQKNNSVVIWNRRKKECKIVTQCIVGWIYNEEESYNM